MVKANADTAYTDIAGIVTDLRRLVASRAASQLTGDGYITRRGLPWNKQLVKRVIERLEELINANG